MQKPDPKRYRIWQRKAAAVGAIVPIYFEVFPSYAIMFCGQCGNQFSRNLIPKKNEPTFICPRSSCGARNWIPVYYEKRKVPE